MSVKEHIVILKKTIHHCESGEGLWLQREAALQTQSFKDAELQLISQKICTKIMECLPRSSDQT